MKTLNFLVFILVLLTLTSCAPNVYFKEGKMTITSGGVKNEIEITKAARPSDDDADLDLINKNDSLKIEYYSPAYESTSDEAPYITVVAFKGGNTYSGKHLCKIEDDVSCDKLTTCKQINDDTDELATNNSVSLPTHCLFATYKLDGKNIHPYEEYTSHIASFASFFTQKKISNCEKVKASRDVQRRNLSGINAKVETIKVDYACKEEDESDVAVAVVLKFDIWEPNNRTEHGPKI